MAVQRTPHPQGTGTPSRASSATTTPRSPKIRNPRAVQTAGSRRERRCRAEGPMLTSGVALAEEGPSEVRASGPQSPVLPPRSSAYINNLKNHLRISSARRMLDEGTSVLTTPTTLSHTPIKPRAATAPSFPITDPSNTDLYHRLTSSVAHPASTSGSQDVGSTTPGHHQSIQKPQRGFSGRKSPQRPASGFSGGVGKRSIPVSTVCPFGQVPDVPVTQHHRSSPPVQQDCVIGDYQMAALYVDKGRVTFFRRTKPDVTQSVYSAISPYKASRNDGSYLFHLRKAYLSGVRDLPKMNRKEPDMDKHSTIRERMDYDRKVGRILDYYTKVEVPKEVHTPRPPDVHASLPPTPFPAARHAFRTFSSKRRVPRANATPGHRDTNSKGLESPASQDSNGHSDARDHLQPSVPYSADFVRINAKAPLHHRQHFYLRTPASHSSLAGKDSQQGSGCVCAMCQIEMDVALMAQLHQDLGVSVDAVTTANVRSSLEMDAGDVTHGQALQAPVDAASEADTCPARPNSVSDSRRSAAPSETPASVSQGECLPMASQQPCSDLDSKTTQTSPVTETTSLTVTLPITEDISNSVQVLPITEDTNNSVQALPITEDTNNSVQVLPITEDTSNSVQVPHENDGGESDINNNAQLTETTEEAELEKSCVKESSATGVTKDCDENSGQEVCDSVKDPTMNTDQERSDVNTVKRSTETTEAVFSTGEHRETPTIVVTEVTDSELQTIDEHDILQPSAPHHSNPEISTDRWEPDDGTAENVTSQMDAAGTHAVPEDQSEPQGLASLHHARETVTRCETDIPVNGNGDTKCARTERQLTCDDFSSDTNGPPAETPTPSQRTGLTTASTTQAASPEVSDVTESLRDTSVGGQPPTIIVSPASDNEEDDTSNETNDENTTTVT
ncbi:uncharacterized protein LOC143277201 [Babylonia areolata]|uniref:uncharacterized protein LOC143277201 n=1 Tax=Babylonia areolata TaxID=304850 RepID=UPI003FCFD72E